MIECDCGSGKVKDDIGHWWWCSTQQCGEIEVGSKIKSKNNPVLIGLVYSVEPGNKYPQFRKKVLDRIFELFGKTEEQVLSEPVFYIKCEDGKRFGVPLCDAELIS